MTNDIDTINVLVIEDNAADAGLIKAHLAHCTDPSFTLHHVTTLQQGLKRLQETNVNIVILDLSLPDSCGLDTFLKLREAASGVAIVIMSGNKDDVVALEAVRQGAQDFFSKNDAICETLGRSLQYAIERFHRQEAERKISAAAFVQKQLYPRPLPPLAGLDVAGRCDPASRVAGDYFDYFMADPSNLILVIGDVSGHGFGPSLVMAETRAALRTMATMTDDVGTMIDRVNKLLLHDELESFVSLFLARLDVTTGFCSYASAGQPVELIRRDDAPQTLESRDPPLGIRENIPFEVRHAQLRRGDTMLLYTDGVSERAFVTPNLFGVGRIRNVIADSANLTAVKTLERLFEEANQFANARHSSDDMTAIVVKVLAAY